VPLDVFTPEAAIAFLCDTANRKQTSDREEAALLDSYSTSRGPSSLALFSLRKRREHASSNILLV
jgi:hypothetical protein